MADLRALVVWMEEEFNGRADEDGEPMFDLVNCCELFDSKYSAQIECAESMNEGWEPWNDDLAEEYDEATTATMIARYEELIPEPISCVLFSKDTGNRYFIDASATVYIQEPGKNPVFWCHQ